MDGGNTNLPQKPFRGLTITPEAMEIDDDYYEEPNIVPETPRHIQLEREARDSFRMELQQIREMVPTSTLEEAIDAFDAFHGLPKRPETPIPEEEQWSWDARMARAIDNIIMSPPRLFRVETTGMPLTDDDYYEELSDSDEYVTEFKKRQRGPTIDLTHEEGTKENPIVIE